MGVGLGVGPRPRPPGPGGIRTRALRVPGRALRGSRALRALEPLPSLGPHVPPPPPSETLAGRPLLSEREGTPLAAGASSPSWITKFTLSAAHATLTASCPAAFVLWVLPLLRLSRPSELDKTMPFIPCSLCVGAPLLLLACCCFLPAARSNE